MLIKKNLLFMLKYLYLQSYFIITYNFACNRIANAGIKVSILSYMDRFWGEKTKKTFLKLRERLFCVGSDGFEPPKA